MVTVERLQRGIEKATAAGDYESVEAFRRELESIQSIQRRRKEGKERRRTELEELRRRAAESSEIFEESKRGSVARGLDIGTDLVAQATGSGLEGIGRVLGLEGLEEYGAEVALENEAEIQRKSRYQTKFDDIEGAGDFFSYLGGVAAESAPAMAAGIVGGIAGAAAAPLVGIGAVGAGLAGATAANVPFFYGMNRERQKEAIEAGLKTEVSEAAAFLTALPQALLDGIADRLLVGGASKLGITQKALTGGGVFTRGTKGVGTGAIVEAPTEIGQQILERAQAGLPLDNEEALAEYREAGIAGGLLGGAIRGTTSAAGIGVETDDTPQTRPEPTSAALAQVVDEAAEPVVVEDPAPTTRDVEQTTAKEAGIAAEDVAAVAETEAQADRIRAGEEQGAVTTTTVGGDATTTVQSIDEFREGVATAPTEETVKTAQPETPKVVTEEVLDALGVSPRAPIRKRVLAPEVTNEEALAQLSTYASNPRIKDAKEVKPKIEQFIAENTTKTEEVVDERQAQATEVEEESSGVGVSGDIQGAPESERDSDTPVAVESGRETMGDVDDSAGRLTTGTGRSDLTLDEEAERLSNRIDILRLAKEQEGVEDTATEAEIDQLVAQRAEVERKRQEEIKELKEQDVAPTTGTDKQQFLTKTFGIQFNGRKGKRRGADSKAGVSTVTDEQRQAFQTEARDLEAGLRFAETELNTVEEGLTARQADLSLAEDDPQLQQDVRDARRDREDALAQVQTIQNRIKALNERMAATTTPVRAAEAGVRAAAKEATPETQTVQRGKGKKALFVSPEQVKAAGKLDRELQEEYKKDKPKAVVEFAERVATGLSGKNPLTPKDSFEVLYPFRNGEAPKGDQDALAAHRYLNKMPSVKDGVRLIVFDMAHGTEYRQDSSTDLLPEFRDFFKGLNPDEAAKAMRWLENNLSKQSLDEIATLQAKETLLAQNDVVLRKSALVQQTDKSSVPSDVNALMPGFLGGTTLFDPSKVGSTYFSDAQLEAALAKLPVEERKKIIEARRGKGDKATVNDIFNVPQEDKSREQFIIEYGATDGKLTLDLPADAKINLDYILHPLARGMLLKGDLQGAMAAINATAYNSQVSKLGAAFYKNAGATKVEIVKDLKNKLGERAAGLFDPKTNTIKLDSELGMNPHVVLHEMTHAVTSARIANNPNDAFVKRLNSLYQSVKDKITSNYGATNLDEFLAEAMSNDTLRGELARLDGRDGVNMLRKFKNIMGNFLRRLIGRKPVQLDARTVVDEIIDGIIAPAPASRGSGELLMAINEGTANKLINANFKEAVRTIKELKEDTFSDGAIDLMTKGKDAVKQVGLQFLNSQALGDVGKALGIGDATTLFHEALERQNGRISKIDERLDGTLLDLESKLKKIDVTAFNRLVHDATYDQVDPSLTKAEAEAKYGNRVVKGTQILKIDRWKELRDGDWKTVGPVGHSAYRQLKNTYAELLEDLKAAFGKRVTDAMGNTKQSETLKNELFEKLFKNKLEPYFPLGRDGDYLLKFTLRLADGSPEVVVESFDTSKAMERFAKRLEGATVEQDGFTAEDIKPHNSMKTLSFKGAPPTSFVSDMMQMLDQNIAATTKDEIAAKEKTIEDLMQQFITALPESSFLKSFKKRDNVLGYNEDVLDTFKTKAYSVGRRTANVQSAEDIKAAARAVEEQTEAWIKSGEGVEEKAQRQRNGNIIINEVKERQDEALSPSDRYIDRVAKTANRFAFIGTMSFSAASAIVNGAQIPAVVLPYLQANTDLNTAMSSLMTATRLFSGSGLSHEVPTFQEAGRKAGKVKVKGMPSIDNYYVANEEGNFVLREDVTDLDKVFYTMPTKDGGTRDLTKREFLEMVKPVIQAAADRGLLNKSLWAETLGVELGGKTKGGKARNAWEKFNLWGALPFHTVERANRQVTIVGAYLNEVARLNTKPNAAKGETTLDQSEILQQAIGTALNQTGQLNGSAALNTAPRIAQSGIGRVAMMFRTYGVTMYYHQFKMARAALKQAKEEGLDDYSVQQARRQFVASQIAIATISGVQGLTLVGIAQALADLFLLDDDEEDADTLTRKYLGDPLYKGGIQYLTSFLGSEVDVGSRIGLSHLILGSNKYDFGESGKEELVNLLGGPALGYGSSVVRGVESILNGDVQRGIESTLPSAARNLVQSARFASEGARTRRGDIIADDFNFGELTAKALGFAPAEYTNAQERNQDLKRIGRKVDADRTRLHKKYYVALRQGDDIADVIEEIAEFNKRHAGKGKKVLITADSIKRSMAQHGRTSVKMYKGVVLSSTIDDYLRAIDADLNAGPYYLR